MTKAEIAKCVWSSLKIIEGDLGPFERALLPAYCKDFKLLPPADFLRQIEAPEINYFKALEMARAYCREYPAVVAAARVRNELETRMRERTTLSRM